MANLSSMTHRMSRLAARHLDKKWLPIRGPGIVSICFDDAPQSACTQGAELLEASGGRGTFYVCGGLTGGQEQGRACHQRQDLLRLHANGHEIGCHTYQHLHCGQIAIEALAVDWLRNKAFFVETNLLEPEGFAFPFGEYTFPSKQRALRSSPSGGGFRYTRSTAGGLMRDRAPLDLLPAQALYTHTPPEYIHELIQQTSLGNAWLILYTHEVEETAGQWGITPVRLRETLEWITQAGCQILSVKEAINELEKRAKE